MTESKNYQSWTDNVSGKKRTKRRFAKIFLILAAFFIIVLATVYILFFSPAFKVNSIKIQGTESTDISKTEKTIAQILQRKILSEVSISNFILLPEEEIVNTVLSISPEIKSASLKNNLSGHTLIVEIKERKPVAIWCRVLAPEPISISTSTSQDLIASSSSTQIVKNIPDPIFSMPQADKCFFADNEGFIFKEAPILSGGALSTVFDLTASQIAVGQTIISPKILGFILETKKEMSAIGLNLSDFLIKSYSVGDLEIIAPEGWLVYLSLNYPAQAQISALKRVLDEGLKGQRSILEYIDLRVQNRVYYKLKYAQ